MSPRAFLPPWYISAANLRYRFPRLARFRLYRRHSPTTTEDTDGSPTALRSLCQTVCAALSSALSLAALWVSQAFSMLLMYFTRDTACAVFAVDGSLCPC